MRAILTTTAALSLAAGLAAQGPAALTPYGNGCPAPDSWYELFDAATNPGDLAGSSLLFTYNGNGYVVTAGGAFDPNFSNNLMLADDQLSVNHPLGFTFPVPGTGRSTTAIDVDSNGYVGMFTGEHSGSDVTEAVADLLNGPTKLAVWWDDLDPSAGGGVYFDVLATHSMVTYDQVPQFGGTDANTCQVQFYPNGDMVMSWVQDCDEDGMVGYSPGNGAPDPGGIDLSAAAPFAYSTFAPLEMTGSGLPLLGGTFNLDFANIPGRATGGIINLGISGATPVDLTPAGMPFCTDYINNFLIGVLGQLPVGNPTASVPVTVPNDPNLLGSTGEMQAVVLAAGVNALGVVTSNGARALLGTRGAVTITATGANSFNSNTASGFFKIENNSGMAITGIQVDTLTSSDPTQQGMVFDSDQTGMADVFHGGNSVTAGCLGTFRNGSDAATGLVYAGTPASPCDATATQGWVGSNSNAAGNYSTIDFTFTNFLSGGSFEWDMDTDFGLGINGGDMRGIVFTVTFQGGATASGELQAVSAEQSQLDL